MPLPAPAPFRTIMNLSGSSTSVGFFCFQLCLDGQKPTQKELDTVAILLAIQKSKEAKEKHKKPTKKVLRVVHEIRRPGTTL